MEWAVSTAASVFVSPRRSNRKKLNSVFESLARNVFIRTSRPSSLSASTFITKSKAYQRDIVPVHIEGQNSNFFYNLAYWRKRLGIKVNIEMAFLVDEFFKQRNKQLTITFGKPISYQVFDSRFTDAQWAEKLRTFSYQLAQDADLVFDPQKDYVI